MSKARFRKTWGPTPQNHSADECQQRTVLPNQRSPSCRTGGRVTSKYRKETQAECHFMPASFPCSDWLLDMRQTGLHSLYFRINLIHWTILMWFDFYVVWQFPKRRSVDACISYIIQQRSTELNQSRELHIAAFVLPVSVNISPSVCTVANLKWH